MHESKRRAQLILLLSLFGVVSCYPLGPVAYVLANTYLRECAIAGVEPDSSGRAARILGLIGTGLLVLTLLAVCSYMALVGLVIASGN